MTTDIRTRVELKNETQRETVSRGVSGKVALIGAFPSSKQRIFAAENFSQIVNHYGINLGTTDEYWYNGVRASKRIFMEGIRGYNGANSITCLNICTLKPSQYYAVSTEYQDEIPETESYDITSVSINSSNSTTRLAIENDFSSVLQNDIQLTFDKLEKALHQIADEDMDLLFISSDLREILDHPYKESWQDYPVTYRRKINHSDPANSNKPYLVTIGDITTFVKSNGDEITLTSGAKYYGNKRYLNNVENPLSVPNDATFTNGLIIKDNKIVGGLITSSSGEPILYNEKSPKMFTYGAQLEEGEREYKIVVNDENAPVLSRNSDGAICFKKPCMYTEEGGEVKQLAIDGYKQNGTVNPLKGTLVTILSRTINGEVREDVVAVNSDGTIQYNKNGAPIKPVKDFERNTDGTVKKFRKDENNQLVEDPSGTIVKYIYFSKSDVTNYNLTSSNGLEPGESVKDVLFTTIASSLQPNTSMFYENVESVSALIKNTDYVDDETGKNTVSWTVEAVDSNGETIYGIRKDGKYIRNLGDIYDYVLDFIENEFTSHRPVSYVGAIQTQGTPEGKLGVNTQGVASKFIKLFSTPKKLYSEESEYETDNLKYNTDGTNPYWNIKEWGVVGQDDTIGLADLFKRTSNELSTCGLFYQSGIINGETVDPIELAAHMCGWICSIPIHQDLTYQTIPGLTSIDEEPFLGENDAGAILNQNGIQIIRPKNRLEKTFYINNSIQPTGWHTNHIRSVIYLLKRLQFEEGLGINNFTTNIEAFRIMLETVAKEVVTECEVIKEVTIGDIEIINSYHIFVPVDIVLYGVVTLINVGVSMALDETGKISTRVKTTTGYSVEI